MIVCIAEKPSVAREIAAVIGANTRRTGFMEGNGYCVTWTYGHLCMLKEPEDYTPAWKQWRPENLPMIPERFGIKPIAQDYTLKQLNIIEDLVAKASEVINCGDAGQEGELIQRWVLQKVGCRVPVKRLWISSLTTDAIREGFGKIRPQEDFRPLYEAGLARAIGDWLLGMNATRLYTARFRSGNEGVLSIGRVQTPTLALIVQRATDIEQFTPETYWELKTTYREVVFAAVRGKFADEAEARAAAAGIARALFVVDDISGKKGKELPPRLFDLTGLQVECNKKFGFSAEHTLKIIQTLYERKLTTYPRVDTVFLPDDLYTRAGDILRGLVTYRPIIDPLLSAKLRKSKKVFDNSKITDHHAIIPTGQPVHGLGEDEQKVFDLVTLRFIGAFYPDCTFFTTTVNGHAADLPFKASGKVIENEGWRSLYKQEQNNPDDKSGEKDGKTENETPERTLPLFVKGEQGPHKPDLQEKQTQPPKAYTEATLLRAMETAGKFTEDEDLRDALKDNGIGRPSTRAGIIETLLKRKYITKQRKNLLPTPLGIDLIGRIRSDILKSVELTGRWEYRLRRIEQRAESAGAFIDELKELTRQVVQDLLRPGTDAPAKLPPPGEVPPPAAKKSGTEDVNLRTIACPACKQGQIIRGRTAFGCSRWKDGCPFRLPYTQVKASTDDADLARLLHHPE